MMLPLPVMSTLGRITEPIAMHVLARKPDSPTSTCNVSFSVISLSADGYISAEKKEPPWRDIFMEDPNAAATRRAESTSPHPDMPVTVFVFSDNEAIMISLWAKLLEEGTLMACTASARTGDWRSGHF